MSAIELAREAVKQIKAEHSARHLSDRRLYRRLVKDRIRSIGQAKAVPMWVIWLAIQIFIWWFSK